MFKEERNESQFSWDMIGDITVGRPNLGNLVEVSVYRLMQFTLREILIDNFDVETADRMFYQAGELAGRELCNNLLNKDADFNDFIVELQDCLTKLKVGILRIEKADLESMDLTLTVAEDLDCSGLPACEETICTYDEGFIRGILLEYTGKEFKVIEVDCWCSGDRVCRFNASPVIG
jgi:uncharacterized protein